MQLSMWTQRVLNLYKAIPHATSPDAAPGSMGRLRARFKHSFLTPRSRAGPARQAQPVRGSGGSSQRRVRPGDRCPAAGLHRLVPAAPPPAGSADHHPAGRKMFVFKKSITFPKSSQGQSPAQHQILNAMIASSGQRKPPQPPVDQLTLRPGKCLTR